MQAASPSEHIKPKTLSSKLIWSYLIVNITHKIYEMNLSAPRAPHKPDIVHPYSYYRRKLGVPTEKTPPPGGYPFTDGENRWVVGSPYERRRLMHHRQAHRPLQTPGWTIDECSVQTAYSVSPRLISITGSRQRTSWRPIVTRLHNSVLTTLGYSRVVRVVRTKRQGP